MKKQIRALASVRLMLMLAIRNDIIDQDGAWRLGTMYFLRSGVTGEFDGRPYYITEETDKKEFVEQYTAKMVYVAKNPTDKATVLQEIKHIELARMVQLQ